MNRKNGHTKMELGTSIHIVSSYINSLQDTVVSFLVFQTFLFFNKQNFSLAINLSL